MRQAWFSILNLGSTQYRGRATCFGLTEVALGAWSSLTSTTHARRQLHGRLRCDYRRVRPRGGGRRGASGCQARALKAGSGCVASDDPSAQPRRFAVSECCRSYLVHDYWREGEQPLVTANHAS